MSRPGRASSLHFECRLASRLYFVAALAVGCAVVLLLRKGAGREAQQARSERHHAQGLTTPWTEAMDFSKVLPEYPRPQMTRTTWLNLNGFWDFMSNESLPIEEPPLSLSWKERIVVPFPVQAPLSQIGRHVEKMWYRRHFSLPSYPDEHRILLHFGAVDFDARIWVNGQFMGRHRGGYDAFQFDITDALAYNATAQNELLVSVFDPTTGANSGVPLGKQALSHAANYSIFYTPVSGIWQTVWLEPVAPMHITRLDLTPDIDSESLHVVAHVNPAAAGMHVVATATAGLDIVGSASGVAGGLLKLHIASHGPSTPRLWSPSDPYLYNLTVQLVPNGLGPPTTGGPEAVPAIRLSRRALHAASTSAGLASAPSLGQVLEKVELDAVQSYFGLRKVGLAKDAAGQLRIQLNNKFLLHLGLLDQGYWPDGLYTAPSDAALQWDIATAQALGFNTLRKHMKVEPARWYYAADRAGLLVWQDMPAMCGGGYPSADHWAVGCYGGDHHVGPADKTQFRTEMERLIEQHLSYPSIVAWVVFNEGWGQHDTVHLAKLAMQLDPSRLVDAASGWDDYEVGMIKDQHDYTDNCTAKPATPMRAAMLGEFGGLGRRVEGHELDPARSFSYIMMNTTEQLEEGYHAFAMKIKDQIVDSKIALSGAIYTELSDVEGEVNGLVTYDRRVIKVSSKALSAINSDLIAASTRMG